MDDYSNPYQQNDQWFADRCGCLTASRAAAVINVSKRDGQPLKSYFDLINTIVSERVTGIVDVTPTTSAMQWGIDNEEEARKTYTLMTGREVELVGFVRHPSIEWFGASPDGLVGSDGLIEIKCPNTATHLRHITANVVPPEYIPQMLVQCLCTGRRWVDFVDYDPRLTGVYSRFAFWTIRYTPTEKELSDALERCQKFLTEVDEVLRPFNEIVVDEDLQF